MYVCTAPIEGRSVETHTMVVAMPPAMVTNTEYAYWLPPVQVSVTKCALVMDDANVHV